MFCTKCQTNWAALISQDDEVGDESYDVCPICGTDSFLVEGKEGAKYVLNICGQVVNVKTGQPKEQLICKTVSIKRKQLDHEFNYKKRAMREDEAIERYQQALSSGMLEEDAKQLYCSHMKRKSKV